VTSLQAALRQLAPADTAELWEARVTLATGRAAGDITALPEVQNITLYRGMDFALMLHVTGSDGLPMDVSGREVLAHIASDFGAEVPDAEWTPTTAPGEPDVIVLALPAAVTALLPPSAMYDVWLCDFPRTPLLAGIITVAPRITRCPSPG
jgi:hypothetical protein